MALLEERVYTVADIEALPEGTRAELIDGRMYCMAGASIEHQDISVFLASEINQYIRSRRGSCKVITAPVDVLLSDDDKNCVQPDVFVVCDKRKWEDGKRCVGAPDWIIEIVSPSSVKLDYMIKLFKYRTAGVREYWIVDKSKNRVLVYNFEKETMEEYTFLGKVRSGIYQDLEIDFSQIGL